MPIYQCGESNPCGWQIELSEDNAELKQRIYALEVENAALRTQLNAEQEVSHSALAQVVALTTESNVWAARWSKMCYACDNEVGRRARANNHIVTLKNEVAALKAALKDADEQNAALKAERDAEKERHANNHAAWTAANEELRDAHQRVLNERDELQQTIATLQSQLQSVTAERDAANLRTLELIENKMDANEVLRAELLQVHNERDAAEDRVRVLEAQLSKAHRKIVNQRDANRRLTEDAHRRKAELTVLNRVAHTEARNWTLTANRLIAARQSRARLVRLVRRRRYDLEMATEDVTAARAWAAMWKHRAKAHRDNSKRLDREADALYKSCNETRAWAAAWKWSATNWRKVHLLPVTLTFEHRTDLSQFSIDRRAQRRAERITSDRRAAEAMERR